MTGQISQTCDQAFEYIEKNSQKNEAEGKFSYYLYDLTAYIFANVILKGFLGTGRELTISGKPAYLFMNDLVNNLHDQGLELPGIIFGAKYFGLGLKSKHREINNKI